MSDGEMEHQRAESILSAKGNGPRLYHTKSRNGCQRCRARRVKCDEETPICGGCRRHSVSCSYEKPLPHTSRELHRTPSDQRSISAGAQDDHVASSSQQLTYEFGSDIAHSTDHDPTSVLEIPESASRRLLELRLLHHFLIQTSSTFPASHIPDVRAAWTVSVPQLANNHPSLLYALLSVSALHLSKVEPQDLDLKAAHRNYFGLALSSHRSAITTLDANSVDAVCFTSVLIAVHAYAELQDRVLGELYEPPMQWLHMSNGVCNIFHIAGRWVTDDSAINAIVKSAPILSDTDTLFCKRNREGLANLLLPPRRVAAGQFQGDEEDLEDEETREAYEKTLSYIGAVQAAIKANEHSMGICRLLIAFAVLIPKKMIELLEEKKPRALVVLAHYFALASSPAEPIDGIWWIGKTAKREVEGIQNYLTEEWQDHMKWPLSLVQLVAVGKGGNKDTP